MISKIKEFYEKHSTILLIIPPIIMGTIHLIATIISFSWITFNYALFCFGVVLINIILSLVKKNKESKLFITTSICLLVLLIPLTVSMVMTILLRDKPMYIFDWLIYAYALYATIKMTLAIRSKIKSKDDKYKEVLSWLSLVGASYTIVLLQFALIKTFDIENSNSMFILQLFTQGFVILFTLFIIVYLLIKTIICKKD